MPKGPQTIEVTLPLSCREFMELGPRPGQQPFFEYDSRDGHAELYDLGVDDLCGVQYNHSSHRQIAPTTGNWYSRFFGKNGLYKKLKAMHEERGSGPTKQKRRRLMV